MKFTRTAISNVVICEPSIIGGGRVYFKETYSKDKLIEFLGFKIEYW